MPRQRISLPQLRAAKQILDYAYVRKPGIIRLHSGQRRVYQERRRFNCAACGRRFGKTTLGEYVIHQEPTIPMGWFSPTYKDMLEVWREVVVLFHDSIKRKNTQERRIELKQGGLLEFWSLDNPDAGRGRKYGKVIIDEAGLIANLMEIWNATIRPTLADMVGEGWMFGTPKGRNGFWHFHQLGQDDSVNDWMSWQLPTYANPFISMDEVEAMRKEMPERIYQQEILAMFIDDAGGVFRRVTESATATAIDTGIEGRQYVIGADWARSNDFTVFVVIDVLNREMVYLDRFTQIDYNTQASRLKALHQRFPGPIIAEYNSMGGPIVERLQSEGLPVTGFVTTNKTKEQIIRGLESAFENGEIRILNDPVLIGELQAYEQERLASGWRFNAPEGMHDDTVMSLALAWSGVVLAPAKIPKQPEQPSRFNVPGVKQNNGGRWSKFK